MHILLHVVLHVLLELLPNSQCFGAVVNQRLLEPRMLQRLLRRDPLLRIVHKDLLQEIQELSVERVVRRDEFLGLSATVGI
jgi:hypothetical protein